MFYIFTSENITFSKYAFYFINNSLYFITLYIIKKYTHKRSVTIQTYTDIALQFCGTRQNELKLITKSIVIFLQKTKTETKKKWKERKKKTCQLDRFIHIRCTSPK